MTPEELLKALPDILDNIEEATELHEAIESTIDPNSKFYSIENQWRQVIECIEESAIIYDSYREAFEDNYHGDIDEWKNDLCETYQACIFNFTDYYIDWVIDYASFHCSLAENKILIIR